MKIFVAGATGALGKHLVPQLVASGHDVVGLTRTESKQDLIRSLGARPAVADALDPDAVARAVAEAEPDVIVHQLTALPAARWASVASSPRATRAGPSPEPAARSRASRIHSIPRRLRHSARRSTR